MIKLIIITLFTLFTTLANAQSFKLLDLKSGVESSSKEMAMSLNDDAIILLGEYHYEKEIIKGQYLIIDSLSHEMNVQNKMAVAWEFLNYPQQKELSQLFIAYKESKKTFDEVIETFFPSVEGKENKSYFYRPIFDAAKKYNGKLVATNAPRAWKRLVVSSGIEALMPEQVPTYMRRGNDFYFDRFLEAMGGHGDPSVIEGYFMAQSYTDAVMADSLERETSGLLTFMTVGSFHSDYGHGLPDYLNDISSRQVINIKIISKKMTSSEEIKALQSEDPKYGFIADYLLIVD